MQALFKVFPGIIHSLHDILQKDTFQTKLYWVKYWNMAVTSQKPPK